MTIYWAMLVVFVVCGIAFIVLGVRRYKHLKALGPLEIEEKASPREREEASQAAQASRIRWIALIVIGVWFFLLAIATLAGSITALVLLVIIPLGIGMFAFGLYYVVAPALYRLRVDDAVFIEAQDDPQPREKDKISRLVFSYKAEGAAYETASQDDMFPGHAEEFKPGLEYTIWVNARKPEYFRIRRFKYFGRGILAVVVGIAVVVGPIVGMFI